MNKQKLTYKSAGVDIDKADGFVKNISKLAAKTLKPGVISGIGPFSALFHLDIKKYTDPVLVSSTDGVGTKALVAIMINRHDTIGIDLVAMCVNDIITCGALPLFFLDYIACGYLQTETAESLIHGIADGCQEAGCSLVGGETAEMPGLYKDGHYDIAGFSVGVVNKGDIIDGSHISDGDDIIGLASNGLHSNGYSLVRKLFFDIERLDVNAYVSELSCTLGEELLRPTRIYVKALECLKDKVQVKAMAHITGGGITDNLPRVLPDGFGAQIITNAWHKPKIFQLINFLGNIDFHEMYKTFNMGIGYTFVVNSYDKVKAMDLLQVAGFPCYCIGRVVKGKGITYL
ncbi:MAG: phosphoribosylformylglycinamidine cyclo-ligase [Candidatus Magnetoovum sp. WYHC-5]|nr:phosphoribosylformylglycinamidine cyclo-ligase [Candidatus Magnetoovum sp. WYHC-5]